VAGHKTLTIRNLPSLISDGTGRLEISALTPSPHDTRKFCQLFLPMLLLGPPLGSFCEHTFTTLSGLAMFMSAALIDL
jgi:hypothetical protein